MTTVIDKAAWPRSAHYDFFGGMSDPFYALTFPVDITPLRAWCRARGLSFYMAMVYGVTKAMERVDAFLYKDRNGVIVKHDRLIPSFTDLRPGSDLFYIVTVEAGEDPEEFCRRAKERSAEQTGFITSGDWAEDELVYFTCLPWFPVTAFTNERDLNPSDSVPRASWGRWRQEGDRYLLDLSLELNHRLLDGVHVGKFYDELTRWINSL